MFNVAWNSAQRVWRDAIRGFLDDHLSSEPAMVRILMKFASRSGDRTNIHDPHSTSF